MCFCVISFSSSIAYKTIACFPGCHNEDKIARSIIDVYM